jgi:Tfp pilus assembly protein FimT
LCARNGDDACSVSAAQASAIMRRRERSTLTPTAVRGTTTVELLVVLVIVSLMLVLGLPRLRGILDRVAVRGAATDAMAAFATARHLAIRRGTRVAVTIDEARATIRVVTRGDTTLRALGEIHGVRLEATRDSMAYTPVGLGYGGSNLRLVLRRGRAAESVYVSRLGRVRR